MNILKIEQAKNTFFNMLRAHAVATSRAMSLDVSTPDEIDSLFDSVSYSKVKSLTLFDYSFINIVNTRVVHF